MFGYLVALNILCSRPGHKGCLLHLVQILNGLGSATLDRLGMPDWASAGGYDRVQRLDVKIAAALDEGWQRTDPVTGATSLCDHDWFTNSFLRAAIPGENMSNMVGHVALAIDGTEVESCGQFHGKDSDIELDGEADKEIDVEKEPLDDAVRTPIAPRSHKDRVPEPKVKVFGVGDDGRRIYTKDRDARASHRTGNANHAGGKYIGRELHLGVAVPALEKTDGSKWAKLGPPVPPVILTADLVPAGAHRAKTVLPSILAANQAGLCHDVIVDQGYSQARREFFHIPLQKAGIAVSMELNKYQRGKQDGVGDASQIDGHLFAEQLPDDLVDLPMPPRGASNLEKQPFIEEFQRRAAYRYSRKKAPGVDGTTRWAHPITSGTLKSRQVPRSMRRRTDLPPIRLEPGADLSTLTAGADALPWWQPCLLGTQAWWTAYARRQQVESVNSLLHGTVGSRTDISRKYTRLRNSGRIKLFLGMTLACYNRWVVDRWMRDQNLGSPDPDGLSPKPIRRAPRRNRATRYADLSPPRGGEIAA